MIPRAAIYIWTREAHPPKWLAERSSLAYIETTPWDKSHYEHRYTILGSVTELARRELLARWLEHSRLCGHPLLWQSSTAPIRHLVSDLDGTLTRREGMVELASLIGLEAQLAQLTNEAMLGHTPFAKSFVARTHLLRGITTQQMASTASHIPLSLGADRLQILSQGYKMSFGVATGAYDAFAQVVVDRLGCDHYIASAPHWDEMDRLVSIDEHAIIDADHKRTFALKQGHPDHILGIGDGANDLPMLASVGYALLYPAATGYASILPPIDLLIERIVRTCVSNI